MYAQVQNHKGTNGVIAILESWLFLADGVVVVVGKGARACVCVCVACVCLRRVPRYQ